MDIIWMFYQAAEKRDEPSRLTYHVESCCCVLRSRHSTVLSEYQWQWQVFSKSGRQFFMVILFPRRVVCQSTQRCCFGLECAVSTLRARIHMISGFWMIKSSENHLDSGGYGV